VVTAWLVVTGVLCSIILLGEPERGGGCLERAAANQYREGVVLELIRPGRAAEPLAAAARPGCCSVWYWRSAGCTTTARWRRRSRVRGRACESVDLPVALLAALGTAGLA